MSISFDVIRVLSKHNNIIGIKEASGDLSLQQRIMSIASDDFYLYSGDDLSILASLGIGAHGYISVIANAFPLEMRNIYSDFNLSKDKSFDIYFKLYEIIDSIYKEVSPIGIKYLMYVLGLIDCRYRRPLDEPSRQTKRIIEEEAYKYLSNL
jgi:4-hydroxy-tetrahydrodipicolinate synthase